MRSKKLIILLIFTVLTFLLVGSEVLYAADPDLSDKKVVVVEKDEMIDDDYFAYGETVTISGTINGDAYLAGGSVLVDGVVNGDLFVAGHCAGDAPGRARGCRSLPGPG